MLSQSKSRKRKALVVDPSSTVRASIWMILKEEFEVSNHEQFPGSHRSGRKGRGGDSPGRGRPSPSFLQPFFPRITQDPSTLAFPLTHRGESSLGEETGSARLRLVGQAFSGANPARKDASPTSGKGVGRKDPPFKNSAVGRSKKTNQGSIPSGCSLRYGKEYLRLPVPLFLFSSKAKRAQGKAKSPRRSIFSARLRVSLSFVFFAAT